MYYAVIAAISFYINKILSKIFMGEISEKDGTKLPYIPLKIEHFHYLLYRLRAKIHSAKSATTGLYSHTCERLSSLFSLIISVEQDTSI